MINISIINYIILYIYDYNYNHSLNNYFLFIYSNNDLLYIKFICLVTIDILYNDKLFYNVTIKSSCLGIFINDIINTS